METRKNFFQKLWTSITDFEKYEEFAADKVSSVIKYLLILTSIFTISIASAYTYKFYTIIQDTKEYISENIEEMTLEHGKLKVLADEPIIIENDNNVIPIIIIDTSENADEEKFIERISAYQNGMIFLSDRAIVSSNLLTQNENIYYSNIFTENIQNKQELMNLMSGNNMTYTYILFLVTIFVYLFVVYFVSNLIDGVVLGVLGYIFARIVRLRLRFKATFNIGIHAISLPIVLNLIYIIVNTFTGFEVTYFQWMYEAISYIYVAVAILMIKTEIINQKIQLIKLEQIQAKVAEEEQTEENQEKQEKDKEKDKEEKKEQEGGEQPEGSNA